MLPGPLSSSHWTSVNVPLHAVAEYRAIAPSVIVPACVSMMAMPVGGAVKLNQTSNDPANEPQPGAGVVADVVALTFVYEVNPQLEATVKGVEVHGPSFTGGGGGAVAQILNEPPDVLFLRHTRT